MWHHLGAGRALQHRDDMRAAGTVGIGVSANAREPKYFLLVKRTVRLLHNLKAPRILLELNIAKAFDIVS